MELRPPIPISREWQVQCFPWAVCFCPSRPEAEHHKDLVRWGCFSVVAFYVQSAEAAKPLDRSSSGWIAQALALRWTYPFSYLLNTCLRCCLGT